MLKQQNWGFDVGDLDTRVRPQDDFFHYAGGTWLKKNPIPKSESRWGHFMKLRYDIDTQLKTILNELAATKKLKAGTDEQQLRDFYLSGMDMQTRTKSGVQPLLPLLSRIEKVSSHTSLLSLIAYLHKIDVDVLWSAYVDQDSKQTTKYRLHLSQGGLGMPDREYYLKNDAEFVRVRDAYLIHIEKLFVLIGYTKKGAVNAAQIVFSIEKKLAEASMTKEEQRDIEKIYNKKTVRALSQLAPNIDWQSYLKRMSVTDTEFIIVEQPLFVTKVSALYEELSFAEWKLYCVFHLVNAFGGALSAPFIAQQFSFHQKTLNGAKSMKPLYRRILSSINNNTGELLGKEYVKRHFSKEAKKKALLMVADLIEAYGARIKKLDWMSEATKKKALKKLSRMNPKIGYPDKWKSYRGLVITPKDYVGNIMRARIHEHKQDMKKLGKPIDRSEWFMSPQEVNAYFASSLNDVVFPAAILQPPFFSLEADDAINYGSMGSVIGHELTHGFDDKGAKRDENGNIKDWWSKEDKKKFEQRAAQIRKQYGAYTVADGVKVSGQLTLGENIADLGGVIIAYDAYQRYLARTNKREVVAGFTPEQRFFLGFALFDTGKSRPEHEKTAVLTDPHSPFIFRINGVLTNVDSFYEAFGLQKGDVLYRPSAKRTRIW